jgi:general stress protein CsbA
MITPLLASSFEGIEIIVFAPVLAGAGILGFLFVWFRARGWALFCAAICLLIGLLAGVCAVGMHNTFAKVADGISAVIGFVLATVFYRFKRKEKSS